MGYFKDIVGWYYWCIEIKMWEIMSIYGSLKYRFAREADALYVYGKGDKDGEKPLLSFELSDETLISHKFMAHYDMWRIKGGYIVNMVDNEYTIYYENPGNSLEEDLDRLDFYPEFT